MGGEENSRLLVGTRGSPLALAQARVVVEALSALAPGLVVELLPLRTSGDRGRVWEVGAFVREVQRALLEGRVDLAVHSLKDLPTESPPGLVLGAVPPRADPRDALVTRDGRGLEDLPRGARVGTASLRRAVQVRLLRPDLEVVPVRGSVGTRLRKLEEGQVDALVLAAAGLERLGMLVRASRLFPVEEMVPAPGQGALAVEVREGDGPVARLVRRLDHRESRSEVTAERAFLRGLGGGCRVPIAAHARVEGGRLVLVGLAASTDGARVVRVRGEGPISSPEALGEALARQALEKGAGEFLEAR